MDGWSTARVPPCLRTSARTRSGANHVARQDADGQPRKLQVVALVERHFDDAFVVDDLAHHGLFGFEQRCGGGHLDDLGHRSDRELEIDARDLLHVQL